MQVFFLCCSHCLVYQLVLLFLFLMANFCSLMPSCMTMNVLLMLTPVPWCMTFSPCDRTVVTVNISRSQALHTTVMRRGKEHNSALVSVGMIDVNIPQHPVVLHGMMTRSSRRLTSTLQEFRWPLSRTGWVAHAPACSWDHIGQSCNLFCFFVWIIYLFILWGGQEGRQWGFWQNSVFSLELNGLPSRLMRFWACSSFHAKNRCLTFRRDW